MAYFDCIVGGSGKGNTLVVTCADELAGATITCTNGTKTYTKTCPSTAPYEVTFYGLAAGTYTVSATVSGNTYTTTVVITDYEAELGGFNWKTWVDLSENYASSDFTDLDDLLSDETAIRELMTIHVCVDYLADIATTSADVETIIGNDLCAKWINNRDYALDTLYANEIIAGYMNTADKYFYGEWVITDDTTTPPTWAPKGNVPVMTSNTAPYGVASASATLGSGNRQPYYAFDGLGRTTGWCNGRSNLNDYIQYQFTNPINAKAFKIATGFDASKVKTIVLSASNDGTNFTDLGTYNLEDVYDVQEFSISNDNYYLYYRVTITARYVSTDYDWITTLQFYGRELSVSVPTMTSDTTPYGEASASTQNNTNYAAWKAFASGSGNNWYPSTLANNSVGQYLKYEFTSPIVAKKVVVSSAIEGGSGTASFVVEGSNDDTNWDALSSDVSMVFSSPYLAFAELNNQTPYKYIRIKLSSVSWSGNYKIGFYAGTKIYGLDYSEKEFEQGTTKKWLYDHGVELESMAARTVGSGEATKNSDALYIRIPSSTNQFSGFLTSGIDLTPYTLLRGKIANIFYSSNASISAMFMRIYNTATPQHDTNAIASDGWAMGSAVLPNNLSLSISSVNAQYYVAVAVINTSTGAERQATIDELWLE